MDDEMDPTASTERGRIGPLGDEAIAEAEGAENLPPGARARITPRDHVPDHDPSSHGTNLSGEDTLSVISDTDVPGEAG